MEGKKILFIFLMIVSFLVIIYLINYTTIIIKGSQVSTQEYSKTFECFNVKININPKFIKYSKGGVLSILVENSGGSPISTLLINVGNKTLIYNTTVNNASFNHGDYFALIIPNLSIYFNNSNLNNEYINRTISIYPDNCQGSKVSLDLDNLIG